MENSIMEAAQKAGDAELKAWEEHVLTPFHQYGIRTFKGLKDEFEKREKVFTAKIKEDAETLNAQRVSEEYENAVKQLNLAGVKGSDGKELDKANPIVAAYVGIDDVKVREEYVKTLLPKSKSGERVSESTDAAKPASQPVKNIQTKFEGILGRFKK